MLEDIDTFIHIYAYTYIHTYMNVSTQVHTYISKYVHCACIGIYIFAYMRVYIHTQTYNTCIHIVHWQIHVCIFMLMYIGIYIHKNIYLHLQVYACIHRQTHTQMTVSSARDYFASSLLTQTPLGFDFFFIEVFYWQKY